MFRRLYNQASKLSAGVTASCEYCAAVVFALLLSGLTITGCGGRNAAAPDVAATGIGQPAALHSNEVLADSGLQVAYTNVAQRDAIDPLYIERQWQQMQRCTGLTAIAPLIIVTEGRIAPYSRDDDLLHHIDGSVTASASYGVTNATIQISDADFDGSLGTVGFNTRSILGRYLWLSSGLAERDYPYDCARVTSLTSPGSA